MRHLVLMIMVMFEELKSYDCVTVFISGGVDSAALLYLISKEISDNKLLTRVVPVHLLKQTKSQAIINRYLESAQTVHKFITERFPQVDITPLLKERCGKHVTVDDALLFYQKIKHEYNTNVIYRGITQSPLHTDRPKLQAEKDYDNSIKHTGLLIHTPFANYTKRDIAKIYGDHNLWSLYNVTSSCVMDNAPCKQCWWCKERHWAFSSYDFGIE